MYFAGALLCLRPPARRFPASAVSCPLNWPWRACEVVIFLADREHPLR